MFSGAKLKVRLLVLSGVLGAGAAGAGVLHSDLFLDRGFGKALDLSRAGLTFEAQAAKKKAGTATPVGDEGFWLTRAEVESPAPFAKPLAVGDRITIAGSDGRERQLEVVDLKALGSNRGRAGHRARLLLVSCRVRGEAADRAEATVRFIIEADMAQPTVERSAKAL
jgi:hypothetical protein